APAGAAARVVEVPADRVTSTERSAALYVHEVSARAGRAVTMGSQRAIRATTTAGEMHALAPPLPGRLVALMAPERLSYGQNARKWSFRPSHARATWSPPLSKEARS